MDFNFELGNRKFTIDSYHLLLLLILVMTFVANYAIVSNFKQPAKAVPVGGDADAQISRTQHVLLGHNPLENMFDPGNPSAYPFLGYMILAGLVSLSGVSIYTFFIYWPAVLAVLISLGGYFLGKALVSREYGLIIAAIISSHALAVPYKVKVSFICHLFLIVGWTTTILLFKELYKEKSEQKKLWFYSLTTGLISAAAILTHIIGFAVAAFFFLAFIYYLYDTKNLKQTWPHLLLVLFLSVALTAVWWYPNLSLGLHNEFADISGDEGPDMLYQVPSPYPSGDPETVSIALSSFMQGGFTVFAILGLLSIAYKGFNDPNRENMIDYLLILFLGLILARFSFLFPADLSQITSITNKLTQVIAIVYILSASYLFYILLKSFKAGQWNIKAGKVSLSLLLVFVLIVALPGHYLKYGDAMADKYTKWSKRNEQPWKGQVGQVIKQETDKNAIITSHPWSVIDLIGRYTGRFTWTSRRNQWHKDVNKTYKNAYELYTTNNSARTIELMQEHNSDYLLYGPYELKFYGEQGVQKFLDAGEFVSHPIVHETRAVGYLFELKTKETKFSD